MGDYFLHILVWPFQLGIWNKNQLSLGWCGSVIRVLALAQKGRRFDSWSRAQFGLQVPYSASYEATNVPPFLPTSLPPFFSSTLSKDQGENILR